MQWEAEGLVLATRAHGESSAIIDVFSREHGRFGGLVRGGNSRRLRPVLQPGNMVVATWRARLSEHLGTITVDAGRAHAAEAMSDAKTLAGLTALCALMLHDEEYERAEVYGQAVTLKEGGDPVAWSLLAATYNAMERDEDATNCNYEARRLAAEVMSHVTSGALYEVRCRCEQ